ncbi:hypothetical protein [Methylocapsa acidiphila]|uniref:hypothetical protein n=1 Tax=Methylocapsa acidiphila TaxID=133552 RepID=UPI00047E617F|nr:hypothetical protein [Methylocapsa acidiphila]
MSKKREMQRLIRAYKDETGKLEIDMKDVARWAAGKGWPLPVPRNPLDLLAQQFAEAAREETRRDGKTGRAYRANHSFSVTQGGQQLHLWIDIDEAERGPFLKSAVTRREQMVGDGLQLTLDIMHWNSVNADEKPIELPMDLTFDIELRLNAPEDDEDDEAA